MISTSKSVDENKSSYYCQMGLFREIFQHCDIRVIQHTVFMSFAHLVLKNEQIVNKVLETLFYLPHDCDEGCQYLWLFRHLPGLITYLNSLPDVPRKN